MMLNRDTLLAQARNSFNAGDLPAAEALCHRLQAQKQKDPDVLELLGRIHTAHSLHDEAVEYLKKALGIAPRDPGILFYLAKTRTAQGNYPAAINCFQKVLRQIPDHPATIAGLAEVHQRRGKHDQALKQLREWLMKKTETPDMALVGASSLLQLKRYDEAIELASRHVEAEIPAALRNHLYHHIGKAHERAGRYAEAFAAHRLANEGYNAIADVERRLSRIDQLMEVYSAESLARLPRCVETSALPVFIVGLPRCGSTLVENIIATHPQAHGAGELSSMYRRVQSIMLDIEATEPYPMCIPVIEQEDVDRLGKLHLTELAKLGRRAKRVVDKYLTNYEHLGLIELLMPGARVIHCRRDPLDMCLSCYCEALPLPANAYATDLECLGRIYNASEQIMRHWKTVLALPILDVVYEDLVADPDTQIRKIIAFIDLEWDDRCLAPHESGRQSITLSRDQIRQPIYTTSVRRSERFREFLRPLIKALETPA